MVMTVMPPRKAAQKREHPVVAKPQDFDAKKGKRFKYLSSDDEDDSMSLHFNGSDIGGQHDPRANQ